METATEDKSQDATINASEKSEQETENIEMKPEIVEQQKHQSTTHIQDEQNKLPVKIETIKSNEKYDNENLTDNENESIDDKPMDEIKLEIENVSQQSSIIDELSPPKSETQSDETNTSSPSESRTPPIISVTNTTTATKTTLTTPIAATLPVDIKNPSVVIVPIKPVANGSQSAPFQTARVRHFKHSGKPLMSSMNKKLIKPRGRPKRNKALVAMYQSEISDHKVGIKLCIKKSDATQMKTKQSRKRSRKSKHKNNTDDSDDSEYEKRRRKEKSNNNTDKQKKSAGDYKEPEEQSVWGDSLPDNILYKIFQQAVQQEGCLPTLFRLGRVCTLWRRVSLSSSLWKSLDLSAWIKEKYRTELKLKWLIDNRLSGCTELNVSNWKVTDIQCVLDKLADACPGLIGITLSGWKGFTSDHLMFLVEEFTKLERIDLSSINVEMNPNKSAVGLQSLCNAIQAINGRLTHLHLAHNRLVGIPQIVSTLAAHCPNLILLDLSNVRTIAISHGVLHVEKLQHGCQKLKVLRITNSHITLSTATIQEQMDSPGFPDLEELSVASLADESRLINDDFLQRILKKSTKLKLLDVRGCARLTHDSLIRLPAWDLKHLFLSGCSVTRDIGSGLELIASKWAHSLTEFDLAWANVQNPLDSALKALAEKGSESPLIHLNLCGSSVSEDAVKEILANCPLLNSINLSSCRGLPRGVKRLMHGPTEIKELREVLKVTLKVSALKQEDMKFE